MARPCCGSTSLCWFLCCYSSCFGLLSASSLASCFPWWPGCGQQHCEHSTSHPCSQPRCCWTLRETPAGGSLCFTAHAGDHEHFETVFCQSPGQVPFLRPLVQPAHTLTWSWAVTLQPCCLCPVLRHWRGTHVAPWGARSGRESPSSCTAVPGCPGRSQAEQVALPEVRMEPKLSFAFALAHCGCSYKLRTAGESKRVVAPETPRAAPNSPNPPPCPQPQLPVLSCIPMMLLSQGLAAQSPSHVPIYHWGFGRQILLLVLQRMQGLAVMKTWAAELSSHCSVGASSAAAPALLQEPSLAGGKLGRCRFGEQKGAGSHGQGRLEL